MLTEVDSAEQERKRLKTNENDKVAVKGASPIITSNIRDPTQSEPNKQRILENQGELLSRMVLRKQSTTLRIVKGTIEEHAYEKICDFSHSQVF
ncbi:hypothetical protein F8M41_013861 [Gigaspora margarita]|uniref:Uncharacterized protein n=1 Tax=Gigaspora margarita TaxID=4874 RepID=A0A8H3WZA0_GIGMA|nr:hypothetical protein F8M41_013861 [Gigaspora margarita]